MGYRLSISKLDEVFYGTKLYGYVNNLEDLESYQFLKKYEYVDGDEAWCGSCENPMIMRVCVFKEFREWYAEDLKNYEDNGEEVAQYFLKETEKLTKLPDYDFIVLTWY